MLGDFGEPGVSDDLGGGRGASAVGVAVVMVCARSDISSSDSDPALGDIGARGRAIAISVKNCEESFGAGANLLSFGTGGGAGLPLGSDGAAS
jgi:hypothetical protein